MGLTPFTLASTADSTRATEQRILVSLTFPKTAQEDPEKLYFRSIGECFAFQGWPGFGNYKFLAALVVAIMAALYAFFG